MAQRAGVSLKTASRALNGEPNVTATTQAKVLVAAQELGFRLNAVAADLARGGASTLVGFITGDLSNPFYSAVASGIERELRRYGRQLLIASSDEDPGRERALTMELVGRRVAALIVTPVGPDHEELSREIGAGLPVVLIDRPAAGVVADTVVIDNRGGMRAAVEHLLAAGHRRIGLIGDESHLWTFQERRSEFIEALRRGGIADVERYVRAGAHDGALARRFASELLDRDPAPTALITANNVITVGVLHAVRDRAAVVPGPRVALIGFDDFDVADLLAVTVVGYDAHELGRQAAALAVTRLQDPTLEPRTVVVPTRLISRGSGEIGPDR
ncbi:MAG TPA: LacI family DNA-binding transcriptional regulator [Propionicimonas sp.]